MADLVVSVFRLTNARNLMAPKIEFHYLEKETGAQWHVVAGGSRAYLCRFGDLLAAKDDPDGTAGQAADSHFMISRLQSALLLGGKGLFQAEPVGRLFFHSLPDLPEWVVQLDLTEEKVDTGAVHDWLNALSQHTMLRRAAADTHFALSNPHEAGAFVYRGFEWLIAGEGRSWDDLGPDIGLSKSDVRDFKTLANVDYGVRHASRSGKKLRANLQNYASWVCALIDAINATRARLEPGYKIADPATVAQSVMLAMPLIPYG